MISMSRLIDIPGRERRLPSFVIERGYMDFIGRMRAEAAWWIPASKGDIKIAVVLGFNRTKPVLVLEEWRAAEQDGGNQGGDDGDGEDDVRRPTPIKSQMVTITSSEEGEYQVTGAPFTIRFRDLFLREPANAQESDFVYTTEDLEQYAKHVWMRQGFIRVDDLRLVFIEGQ